MKSQKSLSSDQRQIVFLMKREVFAYYNRRLTNFNGSLIAELGSKWGRREKQKKLSAQLTDDERHKENFSIKSAEQKCEAWQQKENLIPLIVGAH